MKNIKVYLLLTSLLITLFLFGFLRRDTEPKAIPGINADSIPILLCGSFLNYQQDYSTDNIRRKIIDGSIMCTAGIEEQIKKFFSLSDKPKTIILDKFNHKDSAILILTTLDSVDARFHCKSINGIQFFSTPSAYPLWKSNYNGRFNYVSDITHYIHTGVTAITRSTGIVLHKKGIDWYLENIQNYFKNPDIVHISNEVSMQDTCNYSNMKYKFATLTDHMQILKRLNASVIELTGNHNLDVGKEAYLQSLAWYKQNNMDYFGGGADPVEASRPLVKKLKGGKKVAWIGFNQVCPLGECTDNNNMGALKYNESLAKRTIDSLKGSANVNYIIACVQFSEIDSYKPTEAQMKIAQNLIDMGADVIMGSQAHQPQEISFYHGKPIFYGLGNFLFDQIHRIGVRQAFFLNCYFLKGRIIQFLPVYTFMSTDRQPSLASEKEKQLIQSQIIKKQSF